MSSSSFVPTLFGIPLQHARPLTDEERIEIEGWLKRRRREAWVWAPAWFLLLSIPALTILPFLLMPLFGQQVVALFVALAIVAFSAAFYGALLEVIAPVKRWRQITFALTWVLFLVGLVGRGWGQAEPMIAGPAAIVLVMGGLALIILRPLDRWRRLPRPLKVRRDLQAGEVWIFSQEENEAATIVLPLSGAFLRIHGGSGFHLPPAAFTYAAPPPPDMMEAPGHADHFPETDLVKSYRLMADPERQEIRHLSKKLPILPWKEGQRLIAAAYLGAVGARSDIKWLAALGASSAIIVTVRVLYSAFKMFRTKQLLRKDVQEGRMAVLRHPEAATGDAPIVEFLIHSRVIWTRHGRNGGLRSSSKGLLELPSSAPLY